MLSRLSRLYNKFQLGRDTYKVGRSNFFDVAGLKRANLKTNINETSRKISKKRNNNVDVYKDYSTNKRAQFYGPTNSTELRNESRKVGRFSWFEQEMNSTLEHCEKKSSSSSAASSSSSSSKIEWGVNQRAWFVVFLLFLGRQVEFRVSASKLFSVETGR